MTLEERLASVEERLGGKLAQDGQDRIVFVDQAQNVLRWWKDTPDAIEQAVSYLEYTAERCGV